MSLLRACSNLKGAPSVWVLWVRPLSTGKSVADHLVFKLPDFSSKEVDHVKSQVRVLLYPQCLRVQDGRSEGYSKTSLLDKESFERVFPATPSKNFTECYHQIKQVYPSFMFEESSFDYGPLYAQRVAEALRFCGILDSDIAKYPQLVFRLNANNILSEMELTALQGLSLSELPCFARKGNVPVSEIFVEGYMKKLEYSLRELQIEGALEVLRNVCWNPSQTLAELSNSCAREVSKEIAKELPMEQHELNQAIKVLENRKSPFRNPINVARNFYLYQKYSKSSFKGKIKGQYFQNKFLRADSMETVITMNAFYNYMVQEPTFSASKEEFKTHFRKNLINLQKSSKLLPITVRFKILEDIGFSKIEAFDILTARNAPVFRKQLEDLSFSTHGFVTTMRYRLNLLRQNSAQLGLASHIHFWCAMFSWSTFMNSLAGILRNNESGGSLIAPIYTKNRGLRIATIEALPSKSANHPTILYLSKYFGYTKPEDLAQLTKDAFPSICFPSVPTSRVHSVLQKLQERGFTKEQIRKATPLLSYPLAMVEQKLNEIKIECADEHELVLPICLYCIEKEFNFTSDGLFAGLQKHAFSKELEQEIMKFCGESDQARNDDAIKQQTGQYQTHPLLKLNKSCHRSTGQFLETPSTYSIQQRHFHKVYSSGMTFQGPLKRLKVYLELQKLKNLCDAKFDKQEFEIGTKHALCSVTRIIKDRAFDNLRGLLTVRERKKLEEDVSTKWTQVEKNNIAVHIKDIVSHVINSVNMYDVGEQKFADIDVTFVVSRYRPLKPHFIVMIFGVTFTREYTQGRLPDWTISRFRLNTLVQM